MSLAESHDAVIELVYAVGDHIPAQVHCSMCTVAAISGKQLRSALAMGDERTLDDDPAFAFRMIVDVAIKALSPAVNDPTTAVQRSIGSRIFFGTRPPSTSRSGS